ncbi:MAG TPA: hypothetical protein VMX18_04750 [Candidatus Bipolaricaulota bacterium]|nr:hypothetical protein [Candidatus Bipolaricaulota bacterium]
MKAGRILLLIGLLLLLAPLAIMVSGRWEAGLAAAGLVAALAIALIPSRKPAAATTAAPTPAPSESTPAATTTPTAAPAPAKKPAKAFDTAGESLDIVTAVCAILAGLAALGFVGYLGYGMISCGGEILESFRRPNPAGATPIAPAERTHPGMPLLLDQEILPGKQVMLKADGRQLGILVDNVSPSDAVIHVGFSNTESSLWPVSPKKFGATCLWGPTQSGEVKDGVFNAFVLNAGDKPARLKVYRCRKR